MITRRALFAQVLGGAVAAPVVVKAELAPPLNSGVPIMAQTGRFASEITPVEFGIIHASLRELGVLGTGELACQNDCVCALYELRSIMHAHGLRSEERRVGKECR